VTQTSPESKTPARIRNSAFRFGAGAASAILLLLALTSRAQDNPKLVIDEDCQAFDIAHDNSIVYTVPHIKMVKRLTFERDDVNIATGPGKIRRIVEADKFMPFPPPSGYIINSIAWSPDAKRIAMSMTLQAAPPGFEDKNAKKRGDLGDDEDETPLAPPGGGRALGLIDDEGREIKVAGAKSRFIEGAVNGTWLADDATVVYLTGGGPFTIMRVKPEEGKSSALFEGHTFDVVIWDAPKNRAFAITEDLGLQRGLTLARLDLMHETVSPIAHLGAYQGSLALSPSGNKIGYFEDGDYVDVLDLAHPGKTLRVRVGFGRFGWSRDERKILLKRGSPDKSNILLWVGLYDDSFHSILHDLQFRDFEIAPDGQSIVVTTPGKRVLKLYSLE
jgi:hypothetical protein